MQVRVLKQSFSDSEAAHVHALKATQLDALFASLQQRAFAGEL